MKKLAQVRKEHEKQENVVEQETIILCAANECGDCKHYKNGICTWYNIEMSPSHDANDCSHYSFW